VNSPGEFAVRNPPATARNINQLLKRRVRVKKWDQPAARRNAPADFSLAKQARHLAKDDRIC